MEAAVLTEDHPFFSQLKKYPKCFNFLGGNGDLDRPHAIFCFLEPHTTKPTKNKQSEFGTIILIKNGAIVENRKNDKPFIFLNTTKWEELLPYIENSEYLCYS